MGLKFSDALCLSWGNVAQHKKRSAIIVLTISLLFGVIMGFNFITSGMERTVISAAAGQTGGEVYIEAWYKKQNYGSSWNEMIYDEKEVERADLTPVLDELEDQKVRERAAEYNGEVVGYYWYYQLDHPYRVITKSAVEQFINMDLWESLPNNKMPVLMPEGWEPPVYGDNTSLRDRIIGTIYRVGSVPSMEEGGPVLDGFNPLNVILSQLPSATNDGFWIVDDGSGKVEQYIRKQIEKYLSEGYGWYEIKPVERRMVLRFSDPYQAANYVSSDEEIMGVKTYSAGFRYGSQDLFGTTEMVVQSFNMQRALLIITEIILLIVAVIIAVMTFAHLIDSDAATVALYRSMGASTDAIYVIYLLYLVELCLLAIVATVVIAMMFVGGMALTSAGALAVRLQEFYGLSQPPKIVFYLFNKAFWWILVMILTVAPLSLSFTLRRFSAKHIAKKLKED